MHNIEYWISKGNRMQQMYNVQNAVLHSKKLCVCVWVCVLCAKRFGKFLLCGSQKLVILPVKVYYLQPGSEPCFCPATYGK